MSSQFCVKFMCGEVFIRTTNMLLFYVYNSLFVKQSSDRTMYPNARSQSQKKIFSAVCKSAVATNNSEYSFVRLCLLKLTLIEVHMNEDYLMMKRS